MTDLWRKIKGAAVHPWLNYRIVPSSLWLSSGSPVTLDSLKAHLRIDDNSEDAYLQGLLLAAVTYCQDISNTVLVESIVSVNYATFPQGNMPLALPAGVGIGMSSYTPTITYPNTSGTLTTLTGSQGIPTGSPAFEVAVVSGSTFPCAYTKSTQWPTDYDPYAQKPITLKAGYASATSPTEPTINQLVVAVKMIAGYWYNAREAVVECTPNTLPYAFEALVANCTAFNIGAENLNIGADHRWL